MHNGDCAFIHQNVSASVLNKLDENRYWESELKTVVRI
jgi:hypothetical protein